MADVDVDRRADRTGWVGLGLLLLLLVGGLAWAKWLPYADKVASLAERRTWSGAAILDVGDAWSFTAAYFDAVWKALVVALLVAAAVDSLVPRSWLVRAAGRGRLGQVVVGGLAAVPSMMCTCCTAPVAVGLRRQGVPLGTSLAYWLGNPLLNPAVLVFLVLVLPWQYAAVRLLVGLLLVFGVAALVAGRTGSPPAPPAVVAGPRIGDLPLRYVRSLARFAIVLVPEYVVAVFVVGWLGGYLSDFAGLDARWGIAAVVVLALVGTALVIPTGGEIPVVAALIAAGAGSGAAGALLVTLPAVSIPSIVLVGRALSWRATAWVTLAVVLGGLVSAGLLAAIA